MLQRISRAVIAAVLCLSMASVASACPFCGEANAEDADRSRAFEISIVFMLLTPAVLLGAFGYGFYRLSKREAVNLEQATAASEFDPTSALANAPPAAPQ